MFLLLFAQLGVVVKFTAESFVHVPVLFVEKIYCPSGSKVVSSLYKIENKTVAPAIVVFV